MLGSDAVELWQVEKGGDVMDNTVMVRAFDVLQRMEWGENGRCPLCSAPMEDGHKEECAIGQILHGDNESKSKSWDDAYHRGVDLCRRFADFSNYTYWGRCQADRESLGMGFMGCCPLWMHQTQLADKTSWVHSSVERWFKITEEAAAKSEDKKIPRRWGKKE